MPDLPYLTRMDQFMFGSSLLAFLALVNVIVGSNLADRGKADLVRKLERLGRWFFPFALGGVIVVAFWL